MKTTILTTIKKLLADRFMTTLLVMVLLAGIGYAVYVLLSLQPSDLQVATRYTSFGSTNFYRNKWYYLISFSIFGILTMAIHVVLAAKLYNRGQRSLAVFLSSLSLLVIVVTWITAHAVLRVAFL